MEENQNVIAALEAPFPPEEIRQREGGFGKMLDFIHWTAAVRRLNKAVGSDSWDFEVSDLRLADGVAICKGRLTIRFPDGTTATKEQYGGNAVNQGMKPDDAAKGAGSDALKKCASLFGIALNLSENEQGGQPNGGGYTGGRSNGGSSGNQGGYNNGGGFTPSQAPASSGPISDTDALYCEECGEALTETRFKDGTNWAPTQLAVFGRRKHSRILCMSHYREANQAKRRAEEALQQVPF